MSLKVPIFPIHIWLPEAHVEASTEGSILLAGLLLKIGLFGIVRFLIPIFPKMVFYYYPLIASLTLISIIYVSFIIFLQLDIKKIIAYSSIIHMNFALLGLFSNTVTGLQGSIFMMFTHGFISSALFTLIGFIYIRFNSRIIYYIRGLKNYYPIFSTFFFIFMLGNLGMPGTGGFVGEFLIFLGILNKNIFIAFFSLCAPLFSAIFSLLLFLKLFYGVPLYVPVNLSYNFMHLNKLNFFIPILSLEFYILIFFSFFIFYTGLFPQSFLNLLDIYSNLLLI